MQKKSNYNSPHFFKHKLIFYILKQNLCNFRYFQEIPRQRLAIYSQTWCKWQKHEKFHQIHKQKKTITKKRIVRSLPKTDPTQYTHTFKHIPIPTKSLRKRKIIKL